MFLRRGDPVGQHLHGLRAMTTEVRPEIHGNIQRRDTRKRPQRRPHRQRPDWSWFRKSVLGCNRPARFVRSASPSCRLFCGPSQPKAGSVKPRHDGHRRGCLKEDAGQCDLRCSVAKDAAEMWSRGPGHGDHRPDSPPPRRLRVPGENPGHDQPPGAVAREFLQRGDFRRHLADGGDRARIDAREKLTHSWCVGRRGRDHRIPPSPNGVDR